MEQQPLSAEDKSRLLKLPAILCGKVLKEYLVGFVDYYAEKLGLKGMERKDAKAENKLEEFAAYKKLLAKLERMPEPDTGFQEGVYVDDNGTEHKIRYQFCIADDSHKIELQIAKELVKPLFTTIDNMVNLMKRFYFTSTQQDGIIADLGRFASAVDCNALQINKHSRAMYLDESYDKKIKLDVYFTDASGERLVK